MKHIIGPFVIASLFAVTAVASNAASLESVAVTHGIDSGLKSHPVGQWIGTNRLEIKFQVALPDFKEIYDKSMHFELVGTTIVLHYSLRDVPHSADQPVPTCFETKVLSYLLDDIVNQPYTVQVVSDTAGPISPLPIAPSDEGGRPRYALKLHILSDGSLILDGKPITKGALEKAFETDITYQLPIWFHPDSSAGQEWLELAIRDQLPFEVAKKPDFSDLMEEYGKH